MEFFARFGVHARCVLADAIDIAASDLGRHPDRGPHVVTGPVAVAGAQPGDMLAVTVVDLTRRADYGIVSARHGRGALPESFPPGQTAVSSVFCTALDGVGAIPLRQDDGAFAHRGSHRIKLCNSVIRWWPSHLLDLRRHVRRTDHAASAHPRLAR